MESKLFITECPRDAMQGIKTFIPTVTKIRYLNALLNCGFDMLDFGSFVSPRAVPQMQDTVKVLQGLQLDDDSTPLLAIIANERGASDAASFDEISTLGYPFSVSPTFQFLNTNASMDESLRRVEAIQQIAVRHNKTLLVYLSMAFGNPYGDPYSPGVVTTWAEKLAGMGITKIALADTIGIAEPEGISGLFSEVIPGIPQAAFSAHFHTQPGKWKEKLEAAWKSGCRRFDGAIKGYGGCPMAKHELTGNMPTENLLLFCDEQELSVGVDREKFQQALMLAGEVFPV